MDDKKEPFPEKTMSELEDWYANLSPEQIDDLDRAWYETLSPEQKLALETMNGTTGLRPEI